eukprot:1159408-Pelagomonas_calceolata.AAC.2
MAVDKLPAPEGAALPALLAAGEFDGRRSASIMAWHKGTMMMGLVQGTDMRITQHQWVLHLRHVHHPAPIDASSQHVYHYRHLQSCLCSEKPPAEDTKMSISCLCTRCAHILSGCTICLNMHLTYMHAHLPGCPPYPDACLTWVLILPGLACAVGHILGRGHTDV